MIYKACDISPKLKFLLLWMLYIGAYLAFQIVLFLFKNLGIKYRVFRHHTVERKSKGDFLLNRNQANE